MAGGYLGDFAAHQLGVQLAELFNLKLNKEGRYDTSFGSKTAVGLARCVQRVMQENEELMVDLLGE